VKSTVRVRTVVLSATVGALVATAAPALAGTGVGAIFNLGVANTVDGMTRLSGDTAGAQLKVTNTATSAGSSGVVAQASAAGANSYGVKGTNPLGTGVYGSGGGTGGFFTGTGLGVEGTSAKGDGVLGITAADSAAGVSGQHTGKAAAGNGVAASSANGASLALSQPNTNPAPPITLNGNAFPSATEKHGDLDGYFLPNDATFHQIATLPLQPGSYVLLAKTSIQDGDSGLIPSNQRVWCSLQAAAGPGDIEDMANADTSLVSMNYDLDYDTMNLELFHTYTSATSAALTCMADDGGPGVGLIYVRLMAISVAGGSSTALP
jgi:hypothetical protein